MTAHTDQTGEARVRVVDRPQGQAPGMERDYFNSPEYLKFLLDHCTDTEQATEGRIGGGELTRHHLEKFGFRNGERVLEVGCGTGRVMTMLDKGFGADVHGTDVCADAIDHLKRKRPEFAARARCLPPGDLSAYPDRSFDAIVYWGVFELCEQRLGLLECSRIIREGGRLLLSSVKSRAYHPNDADMDAAVEAYRTKRIPLYLTDVPAFERLAGALGFEIEKRIVYERKADFVRNEYREDTGGGDAPFAEAIYWLRKARANPADASVGFLTWTAD